MWNLFSHLNPFLPIFFHHYLLVSAIETYIYSSNHGLRAQGKAVTCEVTALPWGVTCEVRYLQKHWPARDSFLHVVKNLGIRPAEATFFFWYYQTLYILAESRIAGDWIAQDIDKQAKIDSAPGRNRSFMAVCRIDPDREMLVAYVLHN
jgi:hypothetical protein